MAEVIRPAMDLALQNRDARLPCRNRLDGGSVSPNPFPTQRNITIRTRKSRTNHAKPRARPELPHKIAACKHETGRHRLPNARRTPRLLHRCTRHLPQNAPHHNPHLHGICNRHVHPRCRRRSQRHARPRLSMHPHARRHRRRGNPQHLSRKIGYPLTARTSSNGNWGTAPPFEISLRHFQPDAGEKHGPHNMPLEIQQNLGLFHHV